MKQDFSVSSKQDRQAYQRAYRRQNPDKVKQWRLTEHTKALIKAGYLVLSPEELAVLTNEGRRTDSEE